MPYLKAKQVPQTVQVIIVFSPSDPHIPPPTMMFQIYIVYYIICVSFHIQQFEYPPMTPSLHHPTPTDPDKLPLADYCYVYVVDPKTKQKTILRL